MSLRRLQESSEERLVDVNSLWNVDIRGLQNVWTQLHTCLLPSDYTSERLVWVVQVASRFTQFAINSSTNGRLSIFFITYSCVVNGKTLDPWKYYEFQKYNSGDPLNLFRSWNLAIYIVLYQHIVLLKSCCFIAIGTLIRCFICTKSWLLWWVERARPWQCRHSISVSRASVTRTSAA